MQGQLQSAQKEIMALESILASRRARWELFTQIVELLDELRIA